VRYVALLRAVNVGGNKLAMSDLRSVLVDLGCDGVATYVQSGNAVFTSTKKREQLAREIERRLADDHGCTTTVLLRTGAELAKVVKANPFGNAAKQPTLVHVTFLAATVTQKQLDDVIAPDAIAPEEVRAGNGVVYLSLPNGMGRSKLGRISWQKQLKLVTTTRNWRSVTTLLGMASGS
jgi:uncharacterized protein (DUF1697 family)